MQLNLPRVHFDNGPKREWRLQAVKKGRATVSIKIPRTRHRSAAGQSHGAILVGHEPCRLRGVARGSLSKEKEAGASGKCFMGEDDSSYC